MVVVRLGPLQLERLASSDGLDVVGGDGAGTGDAFDVRVRDDDGDVLAVAPVLGALAARGRYSVALDLPVPTWRKKKEYEGDRQFVGPRGRRLDLIPLCEREERHSQ